MFRRFLLIMLLIMPFCFGGSFYSYWVNAAMEPVSIPDFSQELNRTNLRNIVGNLSAFQLRQTGTLECNNSAYYIQSWLQNNTPASIELQYWSFESEVCMNVIASLGLSGPKIIVCGHYDSISSGDHAPGANDDASGIAAALEAFRMLANHASDLKYEIIFAAFAGEEQALLGSRAFVLDLLHDGASVLCAVNLDTVGYGLMQSTITNQASTWLADIFQEGAKRFNIPIFKAPISYPENSPGDHQSFWNVNIAAVWFYEYGPQYPFFHSPYDTMDKVNFELVAEAAILCTSGLYILASGQALSLPPQIILLFVGLISGIAICFLYFYYRKMRKNRKNP